VHLEADLDVVPNELAPALTTRQCTRTAYDGRAVPDEQLDLLRFSGRSPAVECLLLTTADELDALAGLIERGNRAQLGDSAFRRELVDWTRFNPGAALARPDGLAGRVTGQPPLPTAVGSLLAPLVIRTDSQVRTDRERLASSAGVAAFVTPTDTREAWVDTGRCYERFALRADLLGIRTAFVNQPVEVPELRRELDELLGGTGRTQLLARFGYAPYAPSSLRRPVDDVIER
jgi:hypothetical protein